MMPATSAYNLIHSFAGSSKRTRRLYNQTSNNMASAQNIFLIGAGYIGRNVLDQLLAAEYQVTVLIRRPEQASLFENDGAKTVLGTLNDHELIAEQTAQHRATINTASCDDLPSVEAILAGVRRRVHTGQPVIYIHTSGTGALEDGAMGMYKAEKTYRDDIPEDIDALSPTSMHRHVEIPLARAAREFGEKAKIAIILPPLVYGINRVHNRHTLVLPPLIRFALKHGFVGHVGEGRNAWSTVHVKDLGRAYPVLLRYIESSPAGALSENPYFFAENGSDVSMLEWTRHISRVLNEAGKIHDPNVRAFSESDYDELFVPLTARALGCNSRSRSVRLRQLGWKPEEKDIWTSLKDDDIPAILANLNSESS